jgi:hypothetical protein
MHARNVATAIVLMAAVLSAAHPAQVRASRLVGQARRSISLVVTGGTVVTVNTARRIWSPGAVAIAGADIVDVDTPQAIAARYTAGASTRIPMRRWCCTAASPTICR